MLVISGMLDPRFRVEIEADAFVPETTGMQAEIREKG
jgi:hypothetical protein